MLIFLVYDDVGHGIRNSGTPRQKQRISSQGSIQSLSSNSVVGPAPTTKPPTPPQVTRTGSKGVCQKNLELINKFDKLISVNFEM